MVFANREEAAQLLSQELQAYAGTNAVVLALPRGGVPLGYIIAKNLNLPLDVILIKKIGYPGQEEYAVGAVSLESQILNPEIELPRNYIEEQIEAIRYELQQRYQKYQGHRKPIDISGKKVILVDDGIATGYTIMAAAQLVRKKNPEQVIIAAPVASPRVLNKLSQLADQVICLQAPPHFQAVGQYYHDFSEVSHEEVVQLLADATKSGKIPYKSKLSYMIKEELTIPISKADLMGNLNLPVNASGMVIFSHGSGSSRHSSRNQYVARVLEEAGLGTFLFDLLTEKEDAVYQNRFNIPLLTQRLTYVTQWLQNQHNITDLPLGYFGASTGAASALGAAANLGEIIKAVVSRGGRPDLAMQDLPKVTAATLLVVGSLDHQVIELNEQAYAALTSKRELTLISDASHLFEEPGKLEQVAQIAKNWFLDNLK
ncbi:MAG: phosphoribosyltransferase [Bacteroidota bacterium]|nr:phosphoribosyltransferase [Bacteroidota bacterium]